MRRFAPALLWTLGVLTVCLIPGEDIPHVEFALTDKIAHVVLFAVFGLLWLRAAPRRRLAVFGWGLAFAVLIEVLQGSIPAVHRSADPFDALADAVGLIAAFAIDAAMQRRRSASRVATGPEGTP